MAMDMCAGMKLIIQDQILYGREDNNCHIKVPSEVRQIAENAFYKDARLTTMQIENGVQKIGAHAFADCENLYFASLPKSLFYIDETAFSGSDKLTVIAARESYAYTFCKEHGIPCRQRFSFAIDGEGVLTSYAGEGDVLFVPRRVRTVAPSAFENGCFKAVAFEDCPYVIGDRAFANCKQLCEANIKHTVTTLGKEVFAGCTALHLVYLPSNLHEIGEGIFSGCESLTRAALPSGITYIPARMYEGCKQLGAMHIPSGVRSIGERAFADCGKHFMIDVPDSVESIAKDAFAGCGKVVLLASEGSYAAAFAKQNELELICVYDSMK